MATLHRKKKHPMLILKGYRLYLMGSDDSEIKNQELVPPKFRNSKDSMKK